MKYLFSMSSTRTSIIGLLNILRRKAIIAFTIGLMVRFLPDGNNIIVSIEVYTSSTANSIFCHINQLLINQTEKFIDLSLIIIFGHFFREGEFQLI